MQSVLGLCDGIGSCSDGVCPIGTPMFCPDGIPELWVGTATSVTGTVNIALTICASGEFVSGAFVCVPGSVGCFGSDIAIFAAVISVDGVTIFFNPPIFTDGTRCTFNASLLGSTIGGDFACVDFFQFVVSTGTWIATPCP